MSCQNRFHERGARKGERWQSLLFELWQNSAALLFAMNRIHVYRRHPAGTHILHGGTCTLCSNLKASSYLNQH